MDSLPPETSIEREMERMQDFCKRSSEHWTAVAEALRICEVALSPDFRHQRWRDIREIGIQFGGLERRSGEEEIRGVSSSIDPSMELQRSSTYISDSHLSQRGVNPSKPRCSSNREVWQGAVKPGSNERTKERKERRDQAAKSQSVEAIARRRSNRKTLKRREARKRAKESKACHSTITHGEANDWLQNLDWRTQRRDTNNMGPSVRENNRESGAKRRLFNHGANQAACIEPCLLPQTLAGAALPYTVVEDFSQHKETNDGLAEREGRDVIIETFGQGFIDAIGRISSENEVQGADNQSYACELNMDNVEEETREADSDDFGDAAFDSAEIDALKKDHFDFTNLAHWALKNRKRKKPLAADFMDLPCGIGEPVQQQSKTEASLCPITKLRSPSIERTKVEMRNLRCEDKRDNKSSRSPAGRLQKLINGYALREFSGNVPLTKRHREA